MASGDGNGWVQCRCGHRHWGRHGAAGLLLVRRAGAGGPGAAGGAEALLQLRATWSDAGGTWGLPGGAADSHEDAVTTALREAGEETGLPAAAVAVIDAVVTADHGDWRYTTVLAELAGPGAASAAPHAASAETDEVAWVPLPEVAGHGLHPGLALAWPDLRVALDRALTGR